MLKHIQESLEALFIARNPVVMDQASWSALIDIYQQCSSTDAMDFFIFELEQWSCIPGGELQTLLQPLLSLKTEIQPLEDARNIFNSKMDAVVKSAEPFKNRVTAFIPNIKLLELTDLHWLKVSKLYQEMGRTNLNYKLLVLAIGQITAINYEHLNRHLSLRQPPRRSKSIFKDSQPAPAFHSNSKRNKPLTDLVPSTYVMNARTVPATLAATGVKPKSLMPVTPGKGGYRAPFQSPGNSIYHEIINYNGLTLFDKATPIKDQARIVEHHSPLHAAIKGYKQAKEIRFTVNKETIESCSSKKRIVSQKALTGISCRDVFIDYGDNDAKQLRGNDFHWSHLRAHFLGGQQSRENLAPGTAVSNYNTLKIVEYYIEKKLNAGDCSSIDVIATPYYHGKNKIPYDVVFKLTWNESSLGNAQQQETISINPRSHKRVAAGNLRSIQALRELQLDDHGNQNDDAADEGLSTSRKLF